VAVGWLIYTARVAAVSTANLPAFYYGKKKRGNDRLIDFSIVFFFFS
jgi:hypothetical protein